MGFHERRLAAIHLAHHAGPQAAALTSYQDGFLVAGAVALLAAITSMVRGSAAEATATRRAAEQPAIG